MEQKPPSPDSPEPDASKKPAALINRAAVKRFILEDLKKTRPHIGIDRVSGDALDFYEVWAWHHLQKFAREHSGTCLRDIPKDSLVVASTIRHLMLDLYRDRFRWLTITKVSDWAIGTFENQLREKIHSDVCGHPTVGKTFKAMIATGRHEFDFERTVCSCEDCVSPCRHMSGYLIPSDIERMSEAWGYKSPLDFTKNYLSASPGPLVSQDGEQFHIPTLVPRRLAGGRCIFLHPTDSCRIHHAAPFGCAFFDLHMSEAEGKRRSATGLEQILVEWASGGIYGTLWQILQLLGHIVPAPEAVRDKFDHGITPRP